MRKILLVLFIIAISMSVSAQENARNGIFFFFWWFVFSMKGLPSAALPAHGCSFPLAEASCHAVGRRRRRRCSVIYRTTTEQRQNNDRRLCGDAVGRQIQSFMARCTKRLSGTLARHTFNTSSKRRSLPMNLSGMV